MSWIHYYLPLNFQHFLFRWQIIFLRDNYNYSSYYSSKYCFINRTPRILDWLEKYFRLSDLYSALNSNSFIEFIMEDSLKTNWIKHYFPNLWIQWVQYYKSCFNQKNSKNFHCFDAISTFREVSRNFPISWVN